MKTVTEGNLKIPFIIDFFDVIEEKEQSVWYASNQHNVTFVLVFLKEKKKRMPISEWKEFLVKEMRGNQKKRLYVSFFLIKNRKKFFAVM